MKVGRILRFDLLARIIHACYAYLHDILIVRQLHGRIDNLVQMEFGVGIECELKEIYLISFLVLMKQVVQQFRR